jgi:hypothetical protein
MAAGNLFGADLGPFRDSSRRGRTVRGKPRLVRADRQQLRLETRSLDELIADDHRARTLWQASSALDLSAFYAEIEAVEAGPGRPAIDPRILPVLWLYATSEGVGSARHLPKEIGDRLGAKPCNYVFDGGYAKRESIDHLTDEEITAYAPPQHNPRTRDPSKPRQRVDSRQVAAWKERMKTDEAKEIYKLRGSTIETINGDRNDHRGLTRLRVRGPQRVRCVLVLCVLTYDLMRAIVIAPQVVLPSTT